MSGTSQKERSKKLIPLYLQELKNARLDGKSVQIYLKRKVISWPPEVTWPCWKSSKKGQNQKVPNGFMLHIIWLVITYWVIWNQNKGHMTPDVTWPRMKLSRGSKNDKKLLNLSCFWWIPARSRDLRGSWNLDVASLQTFLFHSILTEFSSDLPFLSSSRYAEIVPNFRTLDRCQNLTKGRWDLKLGPFDSESSTLQSYSNRLGTKKFF